MLNIVRSEANKEMAGSASEQSKLRSWLGGCRTLRRAVGVAEIMLLSKKKLAPCGEVVRSLCKPLAGMSVESGQFILK